MPTASQPCTTQHHKLSSFFTRSMPSAHRSGSSAGSTSSDQEQPFETQPPAGKLTSTTIWVTHFCQGILEWKVVS